METPVSAYAVYKGNKQAKNKIKRKPKSPVSPKSLARNLKEDVMKELAKKVKRKQEKTKEPKTIGKKKTHKKKKKSKQNSKNIAIDKNETEKSKQNSKNIATDKNEMEKSKQKSKKTVSDEKETEPPSTPEVDEVPQLVAVPVNNALEPNSDDDDACSHSSSGIEFTPVETDSAEEGLKVFKWMIAPYNVTQFLNNVWEKKPLHISRKKSQYYNDIISTPIIDSILRTENIQFTKNIDITSYEDGKRETHNPEGRALPHIVWDSYLNGCSIRLLNPQTYITKLHLLNATLQEFFNSFVGANAYLTPPDSQGFAPHYDDIEAFILQAEGKKHWKVYKPRSDDEILPRVSSNNFTDDEIGEPVLEVTLEAGDMLYFPRGYIHQGVTIDGEHSLHVTVSMYQKHSWADLFEKLVPAALQVAITENVEFRRGLPFDIYDNFGLVFSDDTSPRKTDIEEIINKLFDKIKVYLPIEDAVDQMAKNYQHDVLPPVLSDLEKAVTVFGDSDLMIEGGKVVNRIEIGLDTKIRLLRKNILRMVSEQSIRLYYYAENSLEYHGNELTFLEIDEDMAPAVETLIKSYPKYVAVEELDIPNEADKLQIADALWARGLIMTEYPLENIEDD